MKGFTLIEVMVSVGIFTTVMVMSLGALLAMSESNRRVETMKSVINTLNFALDSMSRSVRTGHTYQCNPTTVPFAGNPTPTDCSVTPSTKFAFINSDGRTIAYCLGTLSPLACSSSGASILRSEGGGDLAPITSKEVVIQTLNFYVIGAPSGDNIQPKVTVLLNGYVEVSTRQRSSFNLQTSITQRIYDQ
ncbi:MAG: type II secretion system protein [Patescibacteria group bacterium]